MYKILEARIEFVDNHPTRIAVLVEMSKNDVRSIVASTTPRNGYMHIPPASTVNNDLLQEVAGYGMEIYDKDNVFPNWRKMHDK